LFLQTKCHDIKDICFFKLSVCGGIRNSTDTSIATIQLKPYVRWFILPSKNGIMALLRHSILRQSLLRHSILRQSLAGADPGFQVRGEGGALKKIAPSGGRREHFWGISRENSRFYAKKADYRISLLPLISNYKNKTVVSKLHCMSNL
jgi:hypothetical protein